MSAPHGSPTSSIAPTRERLPDQLRGLALLGIVLVNMPFLALSNAGFTDASLDGPADRVTQFLVVAFAQGKFYLLFSFLFGYSLTLLLRRRSGDGLRRYRRRLAGLAVLGAAHAVLFFIGDILMSYAVLGLALLWFVSRSDRIALRGAAVAYAVGLAVLTLAVLGSSGGPGTAAGIVDDAAAVDATFAGSFLDAAQARVGALPGALTVQVALNWSLALAMFLLGMVAGRRGLLARPEEHRALWHRLLVAAAVVGLPGGLVSAVLFGDPDASERTQVLGVAIGFGTAPFLTAGYVALAALATRSRVLSAMAPAGRMSLTGYLGESILLSAIFCGWGLGLFGELTAFPAALVALAVWLVLDLFAHVWLRRYRYGPFEWVLRAWSYRRRPPFRRAPTEEGVQHAGSGAGR